MTIMPLPESPSKPVKSGMRKPGRLLITLVNIYAIGMILALLGRVLIGERWVVVALYNTILHLLWMPALVLLPLCLLFRQKRTALLLVPAVLAFMVTYGGQFIPRSIVKPDNAPELTMLTYNILAYTEDFSARIALIREADADIVALQEFSQLMSDTVAAELKDMYPYMALNAVEKLSAGQAILSRYPILEDTFWQYEWLPSKLGHQRVVLDVNGVQVVVYNIHTTHPQMPHGTLFDPSNRGREIQDILQRLAGETGHVLMMGDFNMPDLSDDYAHITARFQDAYRAVGWGLGWSFLENLPRRLDYVFYNQGFQPLEAHVWQTTGDSDHYPVFVRMGILPGVE